MPIKNGTASFLAQGQKPNKLHFNLATMLLPDDKLHMEFYTITKKRKHKKRIAIFELLLESLVERKYIDLLEENLSDPHHYLIESTIQMKLYYTAPDFSRERTTSSVHDDDDNETIDWMKAFDDHGGHRDRQVHSKHHS